MNEFPKWAEFTPDFAAAELTRLLSESETKVTALEASKGKKTFASVVLALDDATRALWRSVSACHRFICLLPPCDCLWHLI